MLLSLRTQLAKEKTITFTLRVHPRAKTAGWGKTADDGVLRVHLRAPPEDGKANIALVQFLADEFAVPRSAIEILSGATSRQKTLRIRSA